MFVSNLLQFPSMFAKEVVEALVIVMLWNVRWYSTLPELSPDDVRGLITHEDHYDSCYVLRKVQVRSRANVLNSLSWDFKFLQGGNP